MDRLRTNSIPPDGPLRAKICMIGEAPGADEDRLLKPFVGSAGQLLNRCLVASGMTRGQILVTNIFKQRPPRNQVGYYYSDKAKLRLTWEGEEHVKHLEMWLSALRRSKDRPKLLVALGRQAMYHLTGKKRITKWRGSILPCTLVGGYKVYCCFHPSYVNRLINEPVEALQGERKRQQQNAHALFMVDLSRIKEEGEFEEIRTIPRTFEWNLPYGLLREKIRSFNDHHTVSVDIETLSGKSGPVVWCIGFSPEPDRATVVPILFRQKYYWSKGEEGELWREISRLFLNPKVDKIFQGGTYDLSILGRYYGLRCADGTFHDTMFCHHASYPYIPKGLHVLTSIYTREPYYKDEGRVSLGRRTDEAEFAYNAKDCCVTREIFPIVRRNAKELGTWEGYLRTMSVMPSLLGMMIRGVKINLEKKGKLGTEFRQLSSHHQKELADYTGKDWNVNSPAQMQTLLYGAKGIGGLGLPPQHNRKTGKLTTDADALKALRRKYPKNPVLDHILQSRKFGKLASTYADMKVDSDGRIHTSYGIVSTWRLSSSESPFGSGGNLQNIPVRSKEGRLIRTLFIPDEGKVLLASDLSQAEARVVAWEAGDLRQISLFEKGWDIHWENAKLIFNLPSNLSYHPKERYFEQTIGREVTHKELRDVSKTVVHAGNYGMGWGKLQQILAGQGFFFEAIVCKQLLLRHRSSNPVIGQWQDAVRSQVRSTRVLISSFGRKREFMGRLNDSLYRSAYAFSPQNTVGEILQVAIQRIWRTIPEVEILLNVHDEVMVQVHPSNVKGVLPRIKKAMEIPIQVKERANPLAERELIIPADFKIGWNWGEMTGDIEGFLEKIVLDHGYPKGVNWKWGDRSGARKRYETIIHGKEKE